MDVKSTVLEFTASPIFVNFKGEDMSYESKPEVSLVHKFFVFAIISYAPVILTLNTIVIIGTLLYPGFKTPNNILLLSLAIADFSMGAYTIPMYSLAMTTSTSHLILNNKYTCLAWFASIEVSGGGSLHSLLLISVERFLGVMFPFWHMRFVTVKTITVAALLMWGYTLTMSYFPFFGFNFYKQNVCNFYTTLPNWYVFWAAFGTVGTCISIPVVLYAVIYIHALGHSKRMTATKASLSPEDLIRQSSNEDSVRIFGLLTCLFAALWLPYMLIGPLKYVTSLPQNWVEVFKVSSQLLNFANSFVNAPIYALNRREYRSVYWVLVTTPPWRWTEQLRIEYIMNKFVASINVSEAGRAVRTSGQFRMKMDTAEKVNGEEAELGRALAEESSESSMSGDVDKIVRHLNDQQKTVSFR